VTPLDRAPLFSMLRAQNCDEWADQLQRLCNSRFDPATHGNLTKWLNAVSRLPEVPDAAIDASGNSVCVTGSLTEAQRAGLRATLMELHPWRKGPFQLFDTPIDTEWRSDLKWQRLAEAIRWPGRSVLDVGSGNGYYGWKMLAAGASSVVGCDPFLLYVMQYEVIRRYVTAPERHFVIPLADTDLPQRLHKFDIACSMGVLYHRTSPIDHLQTLWHALRPDGQLALETLVITDSQPAVLVPAGRYAKMRNVWFIPSVSMLQLWLQRTGFRKIQVVDVTPTTTGEQRRTDWMTFESLSDFLDPVDPARTIEGYPAPVRALVTARRS
jgi:tRNA (mo5U34)-methyltransferase